ncbi:hypothetical protein Y032_0089g2235 [Ancylostoma ceylanicum]|uniref:Uncharacterized protein n=1 Tax=Ancylostoma ceylanicum TaxID=53326 RepID=A0A016TNV1_9BILA|nr:hypothetical protein Y032_0089g2235 [Ancylostoma ceylanicum]
MKDRINRNADAAHTKAFMVSRRLRVLFIENAQGTSVTVATSVAATSRASERCGCWVLPRPRRVDIAAAGVAVVIDDPCACKIGRSS